MSYIQPKGKLVNYSYLIYRPLRGLNGMGVDKLIKASGRFTTLGIANLRQQLYNLAVLIGWSAKVVGLGWFSTRAGDK